MRHLATCLLTFVMVFVGERIADAQFNTNNNNNNNNANSLTGTGTGTGGNVSGQTGQSDNFTIQRNANAFIGGAATNFLGGQTGTGAGGIGGLGGLGSAGLFGGLGGFGRGNTGFQNQANSQSTPEPQIRFRMTLGFTHPHPAGAKVSANFVQRLTRLPHLPSVESIAVTMEDRTAVLVGQVGSEHEKMLIENLAMMEPGVSAVRNELTVKTSQELLPRLEATN